jgi:hypothetical protein
VLLRRAGLPEPEESAAPRRHAPYLRLLIVVAMALSGWLLLPRVPHDQTVIFDLGPHAARLARLEVSWEAQATDHEGRLLLNFPSPSAAPEHLSRQFRLADGDYEFRLRATSREASNAPTEATRHVHLEGSAVRLRVEELAP